MSNKPERLAEFSMSIQGGMLEALGINMYTTLGKCLVEFVANGHDGDAKTVSIAIPEKKIEAARTKIRAEAKAKVADGKLDKFTSLLIPLPEGIQVVVRDNGHGMLPTEIQEKFLPLNRKRRLDLGTHNESVLMSESGGRYVMGRKGLGKLAGFGAAECVTIETKRKGETFSTKLVLDLIKLGNQPNVTGAPIPAVYTDALPAGEHYTIVTLSRLKCDAVKFGLGIISETLAEAFHGVLNQGFEVKLNGKRIDPPKVSYEFTFPPKAQRKHNGLARKVVAIPDFGDIAFDYAVYFRKRGQNLAAKQRGARIYCNGRLAAGPSLFGLPTGMHNFHSQSYMECVVQADSLDRNAIDLIATNRTQMREDNEVVSEVLKEVTGVMAKGIAAHGKYRDQVAEREIQKNPLAKTIMGVVEQAPAKMRGAARKLVKTFAAQFGPESREFQDVAPLVLDSMNAGEVLIRLTELGTSPGDLSKVAGRLRELAEIEETDVLKLYKGRRNGIRGLRKLIEKGADDYLKGPHTEADLHGLLKENPWLIHAHFSRYMVSDKDMEKTVTALAKELKIDQFVTPLKNGKKDDTRPDLVFAMADSLAMNVVTIVELKAPTVALSFQHLTQLKGYVNQCEQWLTKHYTDNVVVRGVLIGTLPDADTKASDSQLLLSQMKKGLDAHEEVLGLREMLKRAQQIHEDQIEALKSYEMDKPKKSKPAAKGKSGPAKAKKKA